MLILSSYHVTQSSLRPFRNPSPSERAYSEELPTNEILKHQDVPFCELRELLITARLFGF